MSKRNQSAGSIAARLLGAAGTIMAYGLTATAHEQVVSALPAPELRSIRQAYVDVATGEWSFDNRTHAARSGDFSVFRNGDSAGPSVYFLVDDPARTGTTNKYGTEVLSWGDCEWNMTVDQIVVGYVTNIVDPGEDGVPGFGMAIRAYDAESGYNDLDAQLITTLEVTGLPGAASGSVGWFITIELGSQNAFELGDNDGADYYGNPAGMTGIDEDANGKPDIGWSFQFVQDQAVAKGQAGVVMSTGGNFRNHGSTSAGTEGVFSWFNAPPHGLPIGSFRIGGFPALSFDIDFRGPIAGDPMMDLNDDGVFDVGDLFAFLNRFDLAGG